MKIPVKKIARDFLFSDMYNPKRDAAYFNAIGQGYFPSLLGVQIIEVSDGRMVAEMPVERRLFAPNEFLHAGSIVTFADTIAGYSAIAHLPEGGKSFTTLELKSNFTGAAREGVLVGESSVEHMGRTTQVWRVVVRRKETGKQVAVFSCTQLILY